MAQELLSTHEVAEILGVTPSRVGQLVKHRRDFPAPALEGRGPLGGVSARFWSRRDIERWNASADRTRGAPHGNRNNPRGRTAAE